MWDQLESAVTMVKSLKEIEAQTNYIVTNTKTKHSLFIVRDAYSKVDLLLLCIKMTDTRFVEGDENNAIIQKSQGKEVWKKP